MGANSFTGEWEGNMRHILLMVLLGAGLVACGESKQAGKAGPAEPTVIILPATSVFTATVREVNPSFEFPAVVEAVQLARVRPEISATVKKVHFSPGELVSKGDLLLEFDDATYRAEYELAEANLQSAEASVVEAKETWDRAEELMPKGYISQQDFDKARSYYDMARANLAGARAKIARTKLDLDHTRIYAPFSGKISKSFYAVGESVIPNSPNSPNPLFTLVEMDPIFVTAGVQLQQYHKFVLLRKTLEERGIEVPELEVTLTLAGGDPYPHTGQFEAWDNMSTASSGTITGRLLFPNPEGLLLPGNNVTIAGESVRTFKRVLIPQKAVMQDQQGYYLKIVDKDSVVARRNVELGIRYKDEWIVLDGLEDGARVITVGAPMLREGTPIKLQ
jgi:RND family efflux transporter MFP subunit